MYKRSNDLEKVSRAMKALEQMNTEENCFTEACQQIQNQLHQAISYESGSHPNMSRYSSLNS